MINGFNKVLRQLEEGRNYKKKPPHGPPDDFPSLKQEEVERIQKEQDHTEKDRSYDYTKLLEDYHPTEVDFPSSEELNGTHIFAIDGSNQVVGPPAFKPILAKSSIVEFEYTNEKKLKYHNIKSISTQAIFISEAGVFKDTVDLVGIDLTDESGDEEVSLLKSVRMSDDDVPFLLEANNQTGNPVKEAMGWGVKLQQTLELLNLNLIEDVPGVTIRDGPLLSTSADESDTIKALNDYTNHLKNQTLVSISKNVDNSTLIIECLKENKKLRDTWFPDQQITKRQLEKISGDSSVLDKIISPGERTPFVEAVNLQRAELVRDSPHLAPVACYYLTRNEPREFVRIEVPKFMWEESRYDIDKAMRVIAWQQELGSDIPLIQHWAHRTTQLHDEKRLVKDQIKLEMANKNLDLLGDWENE